MCNIVAYIMDTEARVSREKLDLLAALEKFDIGTPEQIERVMAIVKEGGGGTKTGKQDSKQKQDDKDKEDDGEDGKHDYKYRSAKFPRIALFYGETGKGEVSYRTWRYEVNCLLHESFYSREQILLGIRRSLRGEAADMAMRLGETATVEEILTTFHSAFGNTESAESILKKFHGCVQQKGEPVVKYTSTIGGVIFNGSGLKSYTKAEQIFIEVSIL